MKIEETYPLLEGLKKYKSHFNADQLISLPVDSAYGNLNLSWMEIVMRLECVNELIVMTYKDFYFIKERSKTNPSLTLDEGHKQRFYIEQLVYWLRKTADQLISIISVMQHLKTHSKYPKKITIGSISDFLKSNNYLTDEFDKFKNLLNIINEVSNCYKHSFINSQLTAHRGLEYPVVFAYNLHFNNLSNNPGFYTYDLREILKGYDEFLMAIRQFIKVNFESSK